MFSRSISWLICIFVAGVIATDYRDSYVITASDPAVTVNRFRTYNPQWSMMESVHKVKEIAGDGLDIVQHTEDSAIMTGNTRVMAHTTVLAASNPDLAATPHRNLPETSSSQAAARDPVLRQLLAYLYATQARQLPGSVPQLLDHSSVYSVPALKADNERQVASQLPADAAAATPVQPIKHSSNNLEQATVDLGEDHWGQMRLRPEDVARLNRMLLNRLLFEWQAATSTPTTAETRAALTTTQPYSGHSDNTQTSDSAGTPTVTCPTTPLDDVDVSFMRSFSDDEKGRRLVEAAQNGEVEDLRTLLAAGADLGAKTLYGRTALHWAAWNGHEVAAVCLLDAGADLGAMDNEEYRPLHMAAMGGQPAMVRLLAAWGADLNPRDAWGWTPLHLTVRERHPEAAVALLEVGADKEIRNKSGWTPLDMAQKYQNQEMIDVLTRH